MEILANFFVIIFLSGIISGIILKFTDKSLEKYQNKYLLNSIKYLNSICSSIILIPLQIMVSFLVILIVLVLLLVLIDKIFLLNEFILLLTLSFWMITMQFYMKFFWKFVENLTNRLGETLRMPKIVSNFIGNIFYGKILIYIVALILVILNNTSLDIQFFKNELLEELRKMINSSILIFIAADRIINGIQNWIYKNKNNCA